MKGKSKHIIFIVSFFSKKLNIKKKINNLVCYNTFAIAKAFISKTYLQKAVKKQ